MPSPKDNNFAEFAGYVILTVFLLIIVILLIGLLIRVWEWAL